MLDVCAKKTDRLKPLIRSALEPRPLVGKACARIGKNAEGQSLKVKLCGYLRSLVGRFEIDEPIRRDMTVLEVVNELLDPQLSRSLVSPGGGAPSSGFLFLLNGKDVGLLNGLYTAVNDRDELVIIPVSHGG